MSQLLQTSRSAARRWAKGRSVGSIVAETGRGELPAPPLIRQLERAGRPGILAAGVLSIDQALQSTGEICTQSWLARAKGDLTKAADTSGHALNLDQAQAMMYLAQMPTFASLAMTGKLPNRATATRTFNRTLDAGQRIGSAFRQSGRQDQGRERQRLASALADLSVVLLAERFSIQNGLTEEWFPLLATKPAHAPGAGQQPRQSKQYDVGVMVVCNAADEPALAYKAQVRSSVRALQHARPSCPDISTVCINPDLAVSGIPMTPTTIVAECGVDSVNPSERLSAILAERTGALLELFDHPGNR